MTGRPPPRSPWSTRSAWRYSKRQTTGSGTMKLRQCVFVCKDLESSREELCDILGIEVAYRDPGVAKWGLVNVVCPIGHDFLEIVTPEQPGTSAGRYIERRKGDGGYMVIIQVPDAKAERARVTGLGVRAVAEKDWLKHARSDVTNGLAGVEIQAEDPDKVAAHWSKLLDRPVQDDIIRLDDGG